MAPLLSDALRSELVRLFAAGCLGALPADMPPPLAALADELITKNAQHIAELFRESPTACAEAVYQTGTELAVILNEVGGPAPIYLN